MREKSGKSKSAWHSRKYVTTDSDHHFEPHKIGFKNFDQQSDVPKRGL